MKGAIVTRNTCSGSNQSSDRAHLGHYAFRMYPLDYTAFDDPLSCSAPCHGTRGQKLESCFHCGNYLLLPIERQFGLHLNHTEGKTSNISETFPNLSILSV